MIHPSRHNFLTSPLLWIRTNKIPVFFSFLLFLYFLPVVIQGQDSYILIHDNLDSSVPNAAVLTQTGHIFNLTGQDIVPQIMNGIPRSYIASGPNIVFLFFVLFDPFTAYLLNHILVHLIGFIGMALFIDRHLCFNRGNGHTLLKWGVALAFSVLPFYPMYGISVAGVPIIVFAFLNFLKEEDTLADYLIFLIFPFYSAFFLGGIFLIAGLGIIFLIDILKHKRLKRKAFLAFAGLCILSAVTEYDFIRSMIFDPTFVTHRSDWNLQFINHPLNTVIDNIGLMFFHGQMHAFSHHELILGLFFLVVLFFIRKNWHVGKYLLLLVAVQMIIAIIYGLYFWEGFIPLKEQFPEFSSLNLSRFHWLSPFIWYCIFFLALLFINDYLKANYAIKKFIVITLIAAQMAVNISYNSEYGHYVSKLFTLPRFYNDNITYRQFYSEKLFGKIKASIPLPQEDYRIVSIGIHPGIANYNGFYTLDSYQPTYPLSYKQQFRTIIAPELAKSPSYQAYFDYWGSRCYVFSSELPNYLTTKDLNTKIQYLDLNMDALKSLGGQYILSAAEIMNYQEEGLEFSGVFDDAESAWRIYLYEVE